MPRCGRSPKWQVWRMAPWGASSMICAAWAMSLSSVGAEGGGEGGAEMVTRYLKPQDITIYADDRAAFLKKHRLVVDPQGPVILLDRVWHFDHEWEFPDVGPPAVVYADLLAT